VADDALSRARKALQRPLPKSGAVVPAERSGRNDLIARARAAARKPAAAPPVPVKAAAPVEETKGTALIARIREAAAKPVPVRPVVKASEPPNEPAPAKAGVEAPAPAEAPASVPAVQAASVPAMQTVTVPAVAGQQTVPVPVEVPQNAVNGSQPIVVNVKVVNEQRGWGPYWPYSPYWHGCGRVNCPHLRGLPCNRWLCW
jgi:RNA polymerase-binding transcription factor